MAEQALLVLTTVGTPAQADRLAVALVETRVAACVSRVPNLRSFYRWRGKVNKDSEVLLLIKTTKALYPALEETLKELHPYDVPEVLALPVIAASAEYLDWIQAETGEE